jgi:hypothetical protein
LLISPEGYVDSANALPSSQKEELIKLFPKCGIKK